MYTKTVFIVNWKDLACLNCCYRSVKISGKYIPATHTWAAWVTGPYTCAPYMTRTSHFINQRPKYEPISVKIILDQSSAGLYLGPYFYCLSLQGYMVYINGKLNLWFEIFVLLVCEWKHVFFISFWSVEMIPFFCLVYGDYPAGSNKSLPICLHQLQYCKFIYFLTD